MARLDLNRRMLEVFAKAQFLNAAREEREPFVSQYRVGNIVSIPTHGYGLDALARMRGCVVFAGDNTVDGFRRGTGVGPTQILFQHKHSPSNPIFWDTIAQREKLITQHRASRNFRQHMDKTLLKGLMVLDVITNAHDSPKTVDELAGRVGLTRSNTHRTLQTLMHAGFVVKCDEGGYRGGIRLFEMAARQLDKLDMRRLAAVHMRELAAQTAETVHLSVLDGLDVVYIDKIDSMQPIRAYSMVGGRAPAYAVATGKAHLAYQVDSYLDTYADSIVKHTKSTITSLPLLKEELRKTIRLGYAVNRGEWRATVGGIAVPIFNALEKVVAALGISGPLDRFTPSKIKEWAPQIQSSARAISQQLGHRDY